MTAAFHGEPSLFFRPLGVRLRTLAGALVVCAGAFPRGGSAGQERPIPVQTPPAGAWVESLPNAVVDEALESLWTRFPDLRRKTPDAARRSALLGYLVGQMPGVQWLGVGEASPNDPSDKQSAFHAEVLPDRSAYVRLGALDSGLPARLDTVLADWLRLGVFRVVLDLRSSGESGSLELAAQLAGRFLPEGSTLFSVQSSETQKTLAEPVRNQWASPWGKDARPGLSRLMVVLVGGRTAGPSEALAAVLRLKARAILIGHPTRGMAADFAEVSLGAHGLLRVPVAVPAWGSAVSNEVRGEAVHETGTVLGQPLLPDIRVAESEQSEAEAVAREIAQGKVSLFLGEIERLRMSEAALVAGRNPEWEESIRMARSQKTASAAAPLRDAGLCAALDFFKGWEVLRPR